MKKWLNEFLDRWVILISSLSLGRNRYFQKSIDSPGFKEHIRGVSLEPPHVTGQGLYPVAGETLAGLQETNVVVRLWKGLEVPTIFYQHGNIERPFDLYPLRENLIERIFYPDALHLPDYNLILIRSYIDGKVQDHFDKMQHLNHFMAKLAFYCVLEEKIMKSLQPGKKNRKTQAGFILAGTGFGGTVVNLHRTYFNTADAYVPILAGADPGNVFMESSYRRMTGRLARKNKSQVSSRLNFENDFIRVMSHNVHPILALYDRVAVYQHQSRAYETKPINAIPRGHYTGFTDTAAIRSHLLTVIEEVKRPSGPGPADRWASW